MDKARRPHVTRTWTVERTRVPYRPPQPGNLSFHQGKNQFRGPFSRGHGPKTKRRA